MPECYVFDYIDEDDVYDWEEFNEDADEGSASMDEEDDE
jgi:hypothetical protein